MLNKIALMGRLTRDPELRSTPAGVSVCTVTLAVERDFADSNGVREADFIDVLCWRHTAEFVARNYYKGLLVVCEGRLQTRKWKDRYEQSRVSVEVVADHTYFAERADRERTPAAPSPAKASAGGAPSYAPAKPAAPRGWNPGAADVSTDAPDYAGDLYRGADPYPTRTSEAFAEEEEAHGSGRLPGNRPGGASRRCDDVVTEHERLVRTYNDLPQSDFAGMDDDEVPF